MNRQASMHRSLNRRHSAGVGMIEVLIAIVLLAFGMLGIAALQAAALRSSQSSIAHNEAVAQSYAILDAMRANRKVALTTNVYELGTYPTVFVSTPPATDGTLAKQDLHDWMTRLQGTQGLGPTAKVIVARDATLPDTYRIVVQWDDTRGDVAKQAPSDKQKVETVSRL